MYAYRDSADRLTDGSTSAAPFGAAYRARRPDPPHIPPPSSCGLRAVLRVGRALSLSRLRPSTLRPALRRCPRAGRFHFQPGQSADTRKTIDKKHKARCAFPRRAAVNEPIRGAPRSARRSEFAHSGPRPPAPWNPLKARPSVPPACPATRALRLLRSAPSPFGLAQNARLPRPLRACAAVRPARSSHGTHLLRRRVRAESENEEPKDHTARPRQADK